jgi:hypothetical protein
VTGACATDGCETDGCTVGAWVALGVGVPACAGERTDRMPGIEACVPDTGDPDGRAVDGWVADGWAPVGCGAGV